MWNIKENNDAGWLLLAFLHKLTMDKNKLVDKQFLVSQDTVTKEKNELSGTVDQLQMCINSLKVSKCALEENFTIQDNPKKHQWKKILTVGKTYGGSFAMKEKWSYMRLFNDSLVVASGQRVGKNIIKNWRERHLGKKYVNWFHWMGIMCFVCEDTWILGSINLLPNQ